MRPAQSISVTLSVSLKAAFDIYLADAQARNYSSRTIEHYRTRLRPLLTWCAKHELHQVADVTSTHLRLYLGERQQTRSATTIHTEARTLRAFFNFCVREGWIAATPMRPGMMPRKPKLVRPALSEAQVRQALRRANAQETTIILLLLDTGLRVSELCKLDIADIDLDSGRVRVRQGKGAKDRFVYLGARSRKALLRYWAEQQMTDGPAVVTQRGGRRLIRSTLARTLRRIAQAAGIDQLTPHALRRTFAVMNLRAGVDVYTLARLMGHESIDTLRQYLPLLDGDIEAAHARAAVVDRLFTR